MATNPRPPLHEQLILREMQENDVPAIMDLERACFEDPWSEWFYRLEILPNSMMHKWVLLQRLDERSNSTASTRGVRARPIGYAIYFNNGTYIHLANIAVSPDFQGQGLGKMLLTLPVEFALQQDSQMVGLEVRVSNDVALNLYRKSGFRIIERLVGYYTTTGEDAWFMGLHLATRNEVLRARHFVQQHAPPRPPGEHS